MTVSSNVSSYEDDDTTFETATRNVNIDTKQRKRTYLSLPLGFSKIPSKLREAKDETRPVRVGRK